MTIQKIKSGRVNNVDADNFVGEKGTIFFNESLGDLRISDGLTVGGIPLSFGGGGGGNGNYILPTASTSIKGGVKVDGTTIRISNQVISGFSGSYNDLSDKPTLFSGSYNSLTDKPALFNGSYNSLTDKPALFNGSYNSLTDKPTIPTNTNQLTNGAGYITSGALSGYATESYVTGRGYITSSALTGLATESYVTSRGYITSSALTGYATQSYVTTQGYITSAALSGYALTSAIPTDISQLADSQRLLGQGGGGGGTTYITNNVANPFSFSVAGDDSTLREISNGESIKFTGAGGISVTTDAEGKITITGTTVDLSNYVTLTGEETLTNKTLTSPTINDGVFQNTFTIGNQVFYEHGYNGFSVNENFDIVGENNFTGYHYTSGAGREGVAFTLARTGQFTTGFGIHGTSSNNEYVIGSETTNTDFVFKNNIGMPFDVSGGTEIFRISKTGVLTTGSGESLETIATQSYVTTQGYITSTALTGLATESFVTSRGYITGLSWDQLTNKPNLAGTYSWSIAADDSTQVEISAGNLVKIVGAQGVTTTSNADGQITITGPDLSSYATQSYVTSALSSAGVTVSETAPTGLSNGALWYSSKELELYVRYNNIWVATSASFSGDYNDLTNKPTKLSQFINDIDIPSRDEVYKMILELTA